MLAVKTFIPQQTIFRRHARFMGAGFEIGVVCDNAWFAEECIAAAFEEISRVEKLLSVFNEESAVSLINRNAGLHPVKVESEVFHLISRSLQISELTCGAYDITYSTPEQDDETAGNTVVTRSKKISYKQILLNAGAQTVFLKQKNMRIGFGAVIKAYAADKAKHLMQMMGISNGVIGTNSSLQAWGAHPDGRPWTVADARPAQKSALLSDFNISDMALSVLVNTSYSPSVDKSLNTICPEKGFQVSGINSVFVLSTTAEMAAAMAAPLNAIGINAGLYLINQLNQLACVYTDDQERVYASKGLSI